MRAITSLKSPQWRVVLTVALYSLAMGLAFLLPPTLVRAERPISYSGSGYGYIVDDQRRCISAWTNTTPPSTVTCQEGAPLWRSDTNSWYTMQSGSWTAMAPTSGAITATTGTFTGAVSGTTGVFTHGIQGAESTVALTAASATTFVTVTMTAGTRVSGVVYYSIEADDATDYQARGGIIPFSAVMKSTTITCTVGTVTTATEVVALSSGTLTNTMTCADGTGGALTIKANAASSLTETTLRIRYRVSITGTATVTAS